MANPAQHLTTFDFQVDSFEQLPQGLIDNVGYLPPPNHIWSMNIREYMGDGNRLHVTLTIIYWNTRKSSRN